MAKKAAKSAEEKSVETIKHADKRKNIPTAEYQSVVKHEQQRPVPVRYPRNVDLDPQLVWRGKDEQNWSDLVVSAPPLYIQEKVHPKVLIDDLRKQSQAAKEAAAKAEGKKQQLDMFADFNGVPEGDAKTEFYQHDAHWSNRMILGDSLQVMASLAEREGLRGKVQCIYLDPPYGIKFNSNFQWSTTSRDVKDGNPTHITREPEQVKAFRDTWSNGIHSYLNYLRDRLMVARDLLTESGSVFVQIGDENVHRVRAVMDEVFGDANFISLIAFIKTQALGAEFLPGAYDYIVWYSKNKQQTKFRPLLTRKSEGVDLATFAWVTDDNISARRLRPEEAGGNQNLENRFRAGDISRQGASEIGTYEFGFEGGKYWPSGGRRWASNPIGMTRLARASRIQPLGKVLSYRLKFADFPVMPLDNGWHDTYIGTFTKKTYVVQTGELAVTRCLLMATDPGDLVLDPTCGSGTTAYVAEQWGRRWITIDTSRVALALARARIMGARYPFYLLADSKEGQTKEAELTRTAVSTQPTYGNVRHGFVYERVPHITLKAIANNAEIDVVWENWQTELEPLREKLNKALKRKWQEWEIPREADSDWPAEAMKLHGAWWKARIARQREIDASIAAKAEAEFLYDKPYEDKKKVRVAGPFTVESLSPHRMLGLDENDELLDPLSPPASTGSGKDRQGFAEMILENLRAAGVQQTAKSDRILFTSLKAWPGEMVCAEGLYQEGDQQRRAAILIGPEFGTVQRQDLVTAAREAGDANFDVLIACAFNFDAHSTEFNKLGRLPVLKARMNADLHMAEDLKNTGKGNLFVIFGEPDITLLPQPGDQLQVKVNGVDVFKPQTGEVVSHGADGIACWFIDTDYNDESFFVRHAYFLGQNDPYSALKTTLKAEINAEAWESLNSDTSRPFDKPKSGKIAVKVINHLGDEVMKVFKI
jgi:adenine-specific DNA-methyltransferase